MKIVDLIVRLDENASCGATGSGSVAISVGGNAGPAERPSKGRKRRKGRKDGTANLFDGSSVIRRT